MGKGGPIWWERGGLFGKGGGLFGRGGRVYLVGKGRPI